MNFGGLGGGGANAFAMQQQQQQQSAMMMMQQEMELDIITDSYNGLTRSCFKKCIESANKKYSDGELLNKGEAVCVDRCSKKFMETFERISSAMNERGLQQAQQQAAAAAQQ